MIRDRENCTVFAADLPVGVTEEELTELFKDVCLLSFRSWDSSADHETVRESPGGKDH
jgi:hypothetical protein